MKFITKVLMDRKLKKLRGRADLYLATCDEWEVSHYEQIIQDCEAWIEGTQDFEWDEVMKLANQYWSDCDQS